MIIDDQAEGGKIREGSLQEARVWLKLEESGELEGPIIRNPSREEPWFG
jgi:hypothetical protein